MTKTINVKRTMVIAILAAALTIPMVVATYAEEDVPTEAPEPVLVEDSTIEVALEEETPPEEPVEDTTVDEAPAEDVVENDEAPVDEEEVEEATPVTLAAAIGIAMEEHPDIEVIMAKVKMKMLNEDKVYKIVFYDGWRIYVRASDGEIVRIKDNENQRHNCTKRGERAVRAWREKRRSYSRHHHKYSDWKSQYNQEESDMEQSDASDEAPVDDEQETTTSQ